ncbi:hypothetical protein RHGRI_029302 [Rhododendron griersonianum]|uniref:Uncharacterized protein n=1 Tax=Rhododendron griersonianum TaxID=479676 RepID=A0AAV6IPA4_9ERIC|nr:hypothetical protein RHGRI_029302 [Rhododendron griersonianum]
MGGMVMLFTFPNIVERNSLVNNKDIKNWFVSLKPWNDESSSLSKIVWINCRGMPTGFEMDIKFLHEEPFSSFLIHKNEGSPTGDLEVSLSPQSSGKDVDGVLMESTKVCDSLGEDKADNPSVDEVMESMHKGP